MGSIIDRILETAPGMGDFTARQMSLAVYGDIEPGHISAVTGKLNSLERWGFLRKLDNISKMPGEKAHNLWRAVQ